MNILDILHRRELSSRRIRHDLENTLEDSLIAGNFKKTDQPLPSTVCSTIAVAVSCDGKTFATTHGDHTVKAFVFSTGEQIRTFRGHPRTPWTVKYHPTDPNIIASGCLGFEIRVWSISSKACISFARLDSSIISLAFHPKGDHLVIASGMRLDVWDWRNSRGSFFSQSALDHEHFQSITHNRNIRAVIFHPEGDFLFAAAPDSPKLPSEALTHCRLYGVRFSVMLHPKEQAPPGRPLLSSQRILVPQVHLYSDGGLDISRDGRYLLTCALLYAPPMLPSEGDESQEGAFSFSPMSHSERLDEDFFQTNQQQLHSLLSAPAYSPIVASTTQPLPVTPQRGFSLNRTGEQTSAMSLSSPPPETTAEQDTTGRPSGAPATAGNFPALDWSSDSAFVPRAPHEGILVYPSSRQSQSQHQVVRMNVPSGQQVKDGSRFWEHLWERNSTNNPSSSTGWIPEDYLCLFRLNFENDEPVEPTICCAKLLPGALMKAVTSTKLSPTGRCALVGYGVRVAGEVQDHPHRHAACEVVRLKGDVGAATVMSDVLDEVNIAQFHPTAGHGLIYGTKRGKVRTFIKTS